MTTDKKKKKKGVYNPEGSVRNAMRRAFSRSPLVITMTREENFRKVPQYLKNGERHKIDAAEHLCACCGKWKRGKVAIDHIVPVVDPEVGFVDFNTYYARMFVQSKAELQKLCLACHDQKTSAEDITRKLRDALRSLEALEAETNPDKFKKGVRKWTTKRLQKLPYGDDFLARINVLKTKLAQQQIAEDNAKRLIEAYKNVEVMEAEASVSKLRKSLKKWTKEKLGNLSAETDLMIKLNSLIDRISTLEAAEKDAKMVKKATH